MKIKRMLELSVDRDSRRTFDDYVSSMPYNQEPVTCENAIWVSQENVLNLFSFLISSHQSEISNWTNY